MVVDYNGFPNLGGDGQRMDSGNGSCGNGSEVGVSSSRVDVLEEVEFGNGLR